MFSNRYLHAGFAAASAAFMTAALQGCDSGPKAPGSLHVDYITFQDREPSFVWKLAIDAQAPRDINSADSGSFVLDGLANGEHHVVVSSLPSVCTSGTSDRVISVPSVDTTNIQVTVVCRSLKAFLRVTTTSSGTNTDPDGFALTVGSAAPVAIGINSTSIITVSPGTTTVDLKDIEPSCTVTSPTRTVTAAQNDTLTVAFVATCGAYPASVLGVSVNDPAGDTLPNTRNLSGVAPDYVNINTHYGSGYIALTMKLKSPIGTTQLAALFDLDLDENAATGITPEIKNEGLGDPPQGVDAYLIVQTPSALGTLFTRTGTFTIRMLAEADSIVVYLPYAKLLDDGNLTITAVMGTNRATDIAPNTGVIVSHVPAGASAGFASLPTRASAPNLLRRSAVVWSSR